MTPDQRGERFERALGALSDARAALASVTDSIPVREPDGRAALHMTRAAIEAFAAVEVTVRGARALDKLE